MLLTNSNEWIEGDNLETCLRLSLREYSLLVLFFLDENKSRAIHAHSDCMCIIEITEGRLIEKIYFKNCLFEWKINK